jgi:hypothetical protein
MIITVHEIEQTIFAVYEQERIIIIYSAQMRVNDLAICTYYKQRDHIEGNLAISGLLFKGPGNFWVRIWFVVGTYRVQKGVM